MLGNKGDKGVLLYPRKKGFLPDTLGLPWALIAARVFPDKKILTEGSGGPKKEGADSLEPALDTQRIRTPAVNQANLGVVLGDSMVRFLSLPTWESRHSAQVISIGGATVARITQVLQVKLRKGFPGWGTIILHAGTNNVNKPEHKTAQAIRSCKTKMDQLADLVTEIQREQPDLQVVVSGVIITASANITPRVAEINNYWGQLATRHCWTFVPNDNISRADLKDEVHLSTTGQQKLWGNIERFLQPRSF